MHESHDHTMQSVGGIAFSENDLLTPVTPNDPKSKIEPITFVEGI